MNEKWCLDIGTNKDASIAVEDTFSLNSSRTELVRDAVSLLCRSPMHLER